MSLLTKPIRQWLTRKQQGQSAPMHGERPAGYRLLSRRAPCPPWVRPQHSPITGQCMTTCIDGVTLQVTCSSACSLNLQFAKIIGKSFSAMWTFESCICQSRSAPCALGPHSICLQVCILPAWGYKTIKNPSTWQILPRQHGSMT